MLTFDANDYTVHFTDGQGRTTAPMPLLDLSTECGGGIVVIGGRAFAVEVTDLGWVEASTDSEVPAAEDRRVIAALGKTQKLRVIPIDPRHTFIPVIPGGGPGTISDARCTVCGKPRDSRAHDPIVEVAGASHRFSRSAMDPADEHCEICGAFEFTPIHRVTLEVDPNSDFARAAVGTVTPAAPAASEPLTISPGADVSRDGIGEFIYPDGSPRLERRDPEDVTPSDPDIELNEPCEACGQPDHKHPYDGCDFGAAVLTETGEAKKSDKVDREG